MNDFHIKLSFRKKLLLSFIVLSFIPVLLIGITTYRLYNRFITDMTEKSSVETIDLICNDIDSLLNDTWQLCDALTRDIKIQENLRVKFNSVSSQYSLDLSGSMDMASLSTYRKDIFGVYVLGENGGRYKSNYYSFKPDDPRDSKWYQKIKNSPESIWFSPHEGSFIVRSSIEDRFISVGLPSSDKATGRINGVICADIKEDDLTKKIQDSLNSGAVYLLDAQGNILFQSGNNSHFPVSVSDELTGQILQAAKDADTRSVVIPNREYLVVGRTLNRSGWCIAGVISRRYLAQSTKELTTILLLVLLIIAFSALYISLRISQSVYRPIQTLCTMMEAVEAGDFSVRYSEPPADELGRLGNNFNHMLNKIQELISQIYEEQKKLRNSEFKALQAQIQPHFLYNSLDSVIWFLRMGKNKDAEKMLTELSTLFKISLSKGREIITIEDELKHIGSYLFISNMIYSKKFTYSIECDPSLYQYQTPKLLLRPLAENAILHAVPLPDEKVHIHVSIRENGDCLLLSVQDISKGMSPETLEILRKQINAPRQPDKQDSGYGLYNVNERIRIFYGPDFGLNIDSDPDIGTEITLKIPKLERGEPYVPSNPV